MKHKQKLMKQYQILSVSGAKKHIFATDEREAKNIFEKMFPFLKREPKSIRRFR